MKTYTIDNIYWKHIFKTYMIDVRHVFNIHHWYSAYIEIIYQKHKKIIFGNELLPSHRWTSSQQPSEIVGFWDATCFANDSIGSLDKLLGAAIESNKLLTIITFKVIAINAIIFAQPSGPIILQCFWANHQPSLTIISDGCWPSVQRCNVSDATPKPRSGQGVTPPQRQPDR